MKTQRFSRPLFLLVGLLTLCVTQVWSESTVTTYTFNSKSWGATCNGSAANWTGSKDGNQYSASSSPIGVQILAAGDGTTVTSPKSFTNVSKVVVNYSSSSKGVGSIKVSIGGTDIDTKSISKSQSKVDLTYTPTSNLSGNVVITCNCTTNSYAIVSVSITEESTSSTYYDIIWKVNGETYTAGTPSTSVADGEKVTSLPTEPSLDCGGKTFVGWTATENYSNASSAPFDLFNTAASAPEVTANTTYYAVFADANAGGTIWTKITDLSTINVGIYALITTDGHAFNGSISSGHGQVTDGAFSFVDGVASSAPAGTCEVTLTAVTGGYTIYNAEQGYLYAMAASSGNLAWHNIETRYWCAYTKADVTNWEYCGNNDSGNYYAYLRSYSNNSLRTYSTNNGDVLAFAKKSVVTTYSNYSTTCEEPVPGTYTANVDGSLENGSINLSKMNGNFVSKSLGDLATSTTYYFQVTPNSGYHIQEGSVKVNNSTTGITKVSGDADGAVYSYTTGSTNMTISATFVINSYTVTSTLTNVTASPNIPANINHGEAILTTISADTGYDLPNDITVTGGTKSWNSTTGELAVTNVTGNVNISIVGTSAPVHSIVYVAPTTLSGMGYANGDGANSIIKTFTISGRDLTSSATVTASENFEVSQDGTTFAAYQTLSASAVLAGITIYVRLESGKGNNTYEGNITVSGPEFTTKEVAVSALVAAGHTVTFKNNRTTLAVGGTRLVADGAQVGTLPVLSGSASCDAIGHPVFIGWSATDFGSTTSAPELVTSSVVITDDVTYYAVFGDEGENSTSYYKITDLSQLSEGNYVIAGKKDGTSDYYKMKNEIVSNYYLDVAQANPTADIYAGPGAAYIWRLVSTADGWTIYNANVSKYVQILVSGDYNNLTLSDEPYSFTLSPSDGIWAITHNIDGTTRYLTFRQNNQYNEFAARLTQDNPVYLFKQQIESSSWLTYCIGIITYDANGATSGTAPIDNNEYTYGTQATVLGNTDLAKTHYTFAGWNTAADGTGTHYEAGNSITINGDVTLYAEWTPDVHTVTWSVNGDASESVNVNYGEKVSSLPSNPDIICGGKVFVGWTTSTIEEETDDAPAVLFTDVASSPTIEGNTTFYAVFANEEGAESAWIEVTAVADFTPGVYVFGYKSTSGFIPMRKECSKTTTGVNAYLYSGITSGSSSSSTLSLTSMTDVSPYSVTIGAGSVDGTITIHNGEYFIGVGTSSGNIHLESEAEDWKPIVNNGTLILQHNVNDTYIFQYNTSSPRFTAYTSSQGKPSFYKWSGGTSYTNYSTSCSTTYDLTWHSASGAPQVTQVAGEEPIVPVTPTECANKTFMGWVDAPINELQQDAPSFIDFSTYTVSANTDFYAVYASKNGGKVTGTEQLSMNNSFVNEIPTDIFDGISEMILSGVAATNGWSYFDVLAGDNYLQTKSKIGDLSKIEIKWCSYNSNAKNVEIKISEDGANWTTLSTIATISTSEEVVTKVSPTYVGDYFVRIDVPQRTDITTKCRLNFNYIKFYTKERSFWYSDYSTTCDMAASATMIFADGYSVGESHVAANLPENFVLPQPERDGYTFLKYTIHGQDYNVGDTYLLAHDVNAVCHWKSNLITISENTTDLDAYGNDFSDVDVIILSGATLTITKDVAVRNVEVKQGATLSVTNGSTFTINSLHLKGGLNEVNGSTYAMPRVHVADGAALTKAVDVVNFDLTVDKRNYYPFAVPFAVNVADIDYVDPVLKTASTYGTHYVIKTYDGANRAENGENKDENWTVVESSATLQPGVGYIITAVAPAGYDSRIRIPMSIVNGWTADGELGSYNDVTRNVVTVTAHTGTAAATQQRHAGWNFVADPYLTAFAGSNISTSEGLEVAYASIPTYDFSEYIQTPLSEAVLSPEWGFFVQTATTGTMTFATTGRQQMAPRYLMAENDTPVSRKLQTALVLNSNTDKSDRAGLIISDRYSAAYEIGADLEKMFGSGYTLATYTLVNGTRLAYNAMSEAEAHQLIPVGYRAPEAGSYTFSLDITDDMAAYFERIDLIDYETGELTNLLTNHYTFITERMQNDSRFAINATIRKVPTRLDDGIPNMGDGVQKVIYDEHLYIIDHNKVYDGTGSLITITK